MSNAPGHAADGLVTVAVSRTIKPGCEAAYEEWLAGVCQVATRFDGHLGVSVLRPGAAGSRRYVLIFRFDTLEHLTRWNESPERADWLARVAPMTSGEPRLEMTTGLEHWFTLPDSGAPPPPRHKMALLSWLVIFPLVAALSVLLQPLLGRLPWPLPIAVVTAVMVLLMTYLIMPLLMLVFRWWLFPAR